MCTLTLSHNTSTVWCSTCYSHCITSWDTLTTEKKKTVDLSEDLRMTCCEMNYDPAFMSVVSVECVSDALWIGLLCGVIMILTDSEEPQMIAHFRAHCGAIEWLMKISQSTDLHQQHEHPMILSGGFGEVSSLSNAASEQNGVVMLWYALTANEFSTISKRHTNYNTSD